MKPSRITIHNPALTIPIAPPPKLTLGILLNNFTAAAARWATHAAKHGIRSTFLTEADFQARLKICRACQWWQEDARLGLGRCNHAGCGCTKFKLWLTTERCPISAWPAPITPDPAPNP